MHTWFDAQLDQKILKYAMKKTQSGVQHNVDNFTANIEKSASSDI